MVGSFGPKLQRGRVLECIHDVVPREHFSRKMPRYSVALLPIGKLTRIPPHTIQGIDNIRDKTIDLIDIGLTGGGGLDTNLGFMPSKGKLSSLQRSVTGDEKIEISKHDILHNLLQRMVSSAISNKDTSSGASASWAYTSTRSSKLDYGVDFVLA